jgi:hypothetical protein
MTIRVGAGCTSLAVTEWINDVVTRSLERFLFVGMPPCRLVIAAVAEVSDDNWHLHYFLNLFNRGLVRRWDNGGNMKALEAVLRCLRKMPGGGCVPSPAMFVIEPDVQTDYTGTILHIPNERFLPSIHTSALTEVGREKWRNYLQKQRTNDPDAVRLLFGKSLRSRLG